jgi:hypothetical protein
LGLEVELPVSFHRNDPTNNSYPIPSDRINGLKLAAQYSFFVNEKYKTSMALGYIHEFALQDFYQNINGKYYNGNIYNPFFVAAKRFYNNYHMLLYTGPKFIRELEHNHATFEYAINLSFHYMITGTRNFIGVEWNTLYSDDVYYVVARPQMRVELNKQFMVGVVSSIPLNYGTERFGTFIRLIYEPKHIH